MNSVGTQIAGGCHVAGGAERASTQNEMDVAGPVTKASISPLTQELVRRLFQYNPDNGELVWKERPENDFATKRAWSIWNTRFPGKAAKFINSKGYVTICLKGKNYGGHRIVWVFVTGDWPMGQIDHINGDRADNRIQNLRHVTSLDNGRNLGLCKRNTSGIIGVSWCPSVNKWLAGIGVNNKHVHLGWFDTKEEAAAARLEGERRFGFHPNHGKRVAA